jgi:hypothetical protein
MPYADPERRRVYHRDYMRIHPQDQTYTPAQRTHRAAVSKKRDAKRSTDGAHLLRRYGITLDQYERLLAAQGGHCVFCSLTREPNGYRLAVDHDKVTRRVRGILCRRHNSALGSLGDTEAGICRALEYLRG